MNLQNKCINLGAGNRILKKPDWLNHDITYHRPEIDVAFNLDQPNWPFLDNTFSGVRMYDVLEHLEDPLNALNEIHRILRPNKTASLRVVGQDSSTRWIDITHKRPFHLDSLDILDPTTPNGKTFGFYTPRKWKIDKKYTDAYGSLVFNMTALKP